MCSPARGTQRRRRVWDLEMTPMKPLVEIGVVSGSKGSGRLTHMRVMSTEEDFFAGTGGRERSTQKVWCSSYLSIQWGLITQRHHFYCASTTPTGPPSGYTQDPGYPWLVMVPQKKTGRGTTGPPKWSGSCCMLERLICANISGHWIPYGSRFKCLWIRDCETSWSNPWRSGLVVGHKHLDYVLHAQTERADLRSAFGTPIAVSLVGMYVQQSYTPPSLLDPKSLHNWADVPSINRRAIIHSALALISLYKELYEGRAAQMSNVWIMKPKASGYLATTSEKHFPQDFCWFLLHLRGECRWKRTKCGVRMKTSQHWR